MSGVDRSSVPANTDLVRHLAEPVLRANADRTVLRSFMPGDVESFVQADGLRSAQIVARVLAMNPEDLSQHLKQALDPLIARHRDVEQTLLRHFEAVDADRSTAGRANRDQRLLIGAYFAQEYSFESAALFNPSIVEHYDQADVAPGDTRFIMSLRGVGEGHVSSVTFRTGTWRADGSVTLEKASDFAVGPTVEFEELPNGRTAAHLSSGSARDLSESVIYPFLASQGRGIEDVRLVRFTGSDGDTRYRATFTAFDGSDVRQGLLQTEDFVSYEGRGVEGDLYAGKGMALFPRQINGRYAMLSRQDNRSIFLVYSDDLYQWSGGVRLLEPEYPWEWTQLGNCGSPIEIDEGFLVLTHGVGPVRNYSIGAVLLDKNDPSRILGRLAAPLLEPGSGERSGYVPNIVYTCGALLRGRELLVPFAVADDHTRFCTVSIDRLIAKLNRQ